MLAINITRRRMHIAIIQSQYYVLDKYARNTPPGIIKIIIEYFDR